MLTDAHAKHLLQFRIPIGLLEAGGVRSVTDGETRELLGVHGRRGQDLTGILFPYLDPITGKRTGTRVRLDHHDDDMKYLMEEGCRNLFFPYGVPAAWLADVSIPVVFIEAEKSALAIWALAGRLDLKVVPVAIGGVWGWKRKGGKQILPDGGAKYITAPSPDFNLCAWNGRDAVVLFDSNVQTNFEVQLARSLFSKYLKNDLGARVLWAEVPVVPGCNGPDDFIFQSTDTEAVERMLQKVSAVEEKKEDAEKKTQTVQLVNTVIDIATLFHCEQTGYAVIPINGHDETWRIGSANFKRYVCHWFYQKEGKIPGTQVVMSAINLLEAKANFEGREQQVHVRVAEHDGALWLDLANDRWQAVRIIKDGWTIADKPSVRFLRPKGLLSLPPPVRGGSVEELRRFLNVSEGDFILVVAFLVACLRPRGPYPTLVIHAEQGTGKTTMSRMIRCLVDPNFAMTRSEPKENRDLAISCRNGHVIALDNVSHPQDWLSDTLARINTGDAFATRALYTDSEEELFAACRPVLLNGITAIPRRPDLLDRSIVVAAKTIAEDIRRPEDELWRDFRAAQPGILGALLDAAAKALSRIDQVKLDHLPRMADFAKWVVAAEPALPWELGRFLAVYSENRQDAIEEILDSDPVADLAKKMAPWQGTAAELLAELNKGVPESMMGRKGWYSNPKQVSDHLRRIAPALRRVAIDVKWRRANRARWILIERVGISASPASPASQDQDFQQDGDDEVVI